MTLATAIKTELAGVLADPVFARSPMLTRLLSFLVEESISGRGTRLKSYSVAVDGLGRAPDFDPQVDSYARVQVARLRKSLDAFYAGPGATRPQRLLIDNGSYQVALIDNPRAAAATDTAAAVATSLATPKRRRLSRSVARSIVLLLLLLALAGVAIWWINLQRARTALWQIDDFPSIEMTVIGSKPGSPSAGLAESLRQSTLLALTRFETLRVRDHVGSHADYELRSYIQEDRVHTDAPQAMATLLLVHRQRNQVIWSWSGKVPRDPKTGAFNTDKVAADISFVIGQPTGVLHANERSHNHGYDTPYGCWLGFTAQLQDNFRIGSGPMAHCAVAWHDAAPRNPIAAGLHSWMLLDKSVVAYSEASRQELVEQAIDIAEAARQINPGSSFVQISAVRNFAFAHRDAELQATIRQALALNPDNLDVKGVAGMMLVLNNHPEGLPLLHEAITRHFNPPAWYFIGLYMSAMMNDDVVVARQALVRASSLRHSVPVVHLLAAALEARSGNMDKARAAWSQAEKMVPMLRINHTYVFDRLPINATVKARMLRWLSPLFK